MVKNAAAGITQLHGSSDSGSSCVPVPASLPWVTAVGGTNLLLDGDNRIESLFAYILEQGSDR